MRVTIVCQMTTEDLEAMDFNDTPKIIRSTGTLENQISVCFVLQTAFFKLKPILRHLYRMTPKITLNSLEVNAPMYVLQFSTSES